MLFVTGPMASIANWNYNYFINQGKVYVEISKILVYNTRMTRINIVDPSELYDQHLVAEYRELFMVGSALQRSLRSPNWNVERIPKSFTLNKGHVSFFYNKGKYLYNRYLDIIAEMQHRGMNPDPDRVFKREQWPDELYLNWTPSESDKEIVRARIRERVAAKPTWYRKTVGP